MATPIDVVVFKCLKDLSDGKSTKSCVIYLTNKQNLAASQTLATAHIASKICQGQPPKMYSHCCGISSQCISFDCCG